MNGYHIVRGLYTLYNTRICQTALRESQSNRIFACCSYKCTFADPFLSFPLNAQLYLARPVLGYGMRSLFFYSFSRISHCQPSSQVPTTRLHHQQPTPMSCPPLINPNSLHDGMTMLYLHFIVLCLFSSPAAA